MDKFDTIYADSINSDIEFDVIFNSDGELVEAVDPKHFFDNDGNDKFDIVKEDNTIHAETSEDLDSYIESMDTEEEGDPGDEGDTELEEKSCSESDDDLDDDDDDYDDKDDDYDDDEEDLDESDVTSWYEDDEPYYGHQDDDPHDGVHSHTHCHGDYCHNHPHSHEEDHYDHHHHEPGDEHHPPMHHGHQDDHECDHHDEYYGKHHDYDRDDWHDKEKYHDHNDTDYFSPKHKEPITVDDLDDQVARYDMETREYDKQAIHAGCAKETKSTGDLDKYVSFREEDGDGDLIDKADNDGPDENATPADFQIPSDQQTNKFEVDRKLKEATTVDELDIAVGGLLGLGGTSSLGPNIGLETEESEHPGSDESLEDGEDIDSIMGESFFF